MVLHTLINEIDLKNRIKELAQQIQKDFDNEEIIFICILKGSVFFTTELAKNITSSVILDFMRVSSYSGTHSTGKLNFSLDISENIIDKNVVIIEDIIDTGRTLYYLKNYFKEKKPKVLKICTLLDKKERREFDIEPDYVGFDIPDKFVVGFGLDYDEKYRNLPFIGYLE